MIVSGIDIGSLTGKVVILDDKKIIASKIIQVKRNPILTSKLVYNACLEEAGLKLTDIDFCVGTGYGRERIPFITKSVTEISCHGKGSYIQNNSIRSIIDIGGQDCKVITVDSNGDLNDFLMNDKCAAGTGRYLEIMAELLNVSLDKLGSISLKSNSPISINSNCSIYAQSEVLGYIAKKIRIEDIAAGVNQAMAKRVLMMANKFQGKLMPDFVLTGGVAKNKMVKRELEKLLGISFKTIEIDPQLVGAFGAAHIARESL